MVAISPHIAAHRDLHTLRASLCEQYGKMYRAYTVTHHHYFKGICKGLHQAVKEIDALLDMPFDLSAERDRLDHAENQPRHKASQSPWRNIAGITLAAICGLWFCWSLMKVNQ